jgi:hypothetical protein
MVRQLRRRSGGISMPDYPAQNFIADLQDPKLTVDDKIDLFLSLSTYVHSNFCVRSCLFIRIPISYL